MDDNVKRQDDNKDNQEENIKVLCSLDLGNEEVCYAMML